MVAGKSEKAVLQLRHVAGSGTMIIVCKAGVGVE